MSFVNIHITSHGPVFRRKAVHIGSTHSFDVLQASGMSIYVEPGALLEVDQEPWRDDPSLLMHEASE